MPIAQFTRFFSVYQIMDAAQMTDLVVGFTVLIEVGLSPSLSPQPVTSDIIIHRPKQAKLVERSKKTKLELSLSCNLTHSATK